ncbi:MAG: SEC-C domain-containing protein [ANME-2 cluster archaeon]|jgi:tetratricopeptide (TPR) repeat protein|nr:SEC-C domain-containing protein [ANME-2 cluster archaeon]
MSQKINRNDPCPCGSGKKYKHCCLKKDAKVNQKYSGKRPFIGCLTIMRIDQEFKDNPKKFEELGKNYGYPIDREKMKESMLHSWDFNKIRKMSTKEIIDKLHSLNIKFSVDDFKRQAGNYISSIQLAKDYYFTQDHHAKGWDEDFILLAIYELWKRIIPDQVNIEMIDDEMQEGYDALKSDKLNECIEKWSRAWKTIVTIVPAYIDSVEEADQFMLEPLTQSIYNWCQDFEMELLNAGLQDKSYFKKRIEYCNKFYRLFPETDDLIIQNMLRAEAESYAELGEFETADKLFGDLVNKYPDSIWGYVGWGDMYNWAKFIDKGFPNYKKAEEIYLCGLEQCDDENNAISDRLEDLKKKMNEKTE